MLTTAQVFRAYGTDQFPDGTIGADASYDDVTLVIASVAVFAKTGAPKTVHLTVTDPSTGQKLVDLDIHPNASTRTFQISGYSMQLSSEGLRFPWDISVASV